jgi:hypothetical protein
MKDFEVAYRLYKTNEILGHCNTVKGTYNADTKTVVLRMTDAQFLAYHIASEIPAEEIARWEETNNRSIPLYDIATFYAEAYLNDEIDRDAMGGWTGRKRSLKLWITSITNK